MKKALWPFKPFPAEGPPGYILLEEAGRGGTGIVYKAANKRTGRLAAVKVLQLPVPTEPAATETVRLRFEQEAWAGSSLAHPHIAQQLDQGWLEDGSPFLVFEYLEGETLKTYIRDGNIPDPLLTGKWMGQVLEALAATHRLQLLHGDLKPQNIMICQDATSLSARLFDFGCCVSYNDSQPTEGYAHMAGTPSYAPPELIRGERPGPASDLYSWGLILLECLTGQPVMWGSSAAAVHKRHLSSREIPIPSFLSIHPLGSLLKEVLRKNILQRTADAQQLAARYGNIDFGTIIPESGRTPVNRRFYDPDTETTRINPAVT